MKVTFYLITFFLIQVENQETLDDTIQEFNDAFKRGDVAYLKNAITEDYWHTNGNSKPIDGDIWLKYLVKRTKQIESGELAVLKYELSDKVIKYYNDAAIMTGVINIEQRRSGKIETKSFRVTNVWVNVNGKWKRAGFHDHLLSESN